jgi:hypothetical protein
MIITEQGFICMRWDVGDHYAQRPPATFVLVQTQYEDWDWRELGMGFAHVFPTQEAAIECLTKHEMFGAVLPFVHQKWVEP